MQSSESVTLKVLVRHIDPLLAMGLCAALETQPGISAQLGPAARDAAAPGDADVVVTDLDDGVRLALDDRPPVRGFAPRKTRVLVVSAQPKEKDVRTAFDGGIAGYILSSSTVDELTSAVRALGRGARYLCPPVAETMAASLIQIALTPRQLDVLELMAEGHSNKAIARLLELTIGTVKAHVKQILFKLGAQSRMHAVSVAMQRGLVSGVAPLEGDQAPRRRARQAAVEQQAPGHRAPAAQPISLMFWPARDIACVAQ